MASSNQVVDLRTSRAGIIGALLVGVVLILLAVGEISEGRSYDGYGETVTATVVERSGYRRNAKVVLEFTTRDGRPVTVHRSGRGLPSKGDQVDVTYDSRDPQQWRFGTTVPDRTGVVLTVGGAVVMFGVAGWITLNRLRNRGRTAGVGGTSFL